VRAARTSQTARFANGGPERVVGVLETESGLQWRIPARLQLRSGADKYVLKRLMRDRLPGWDVGQEKTGLSISLAECLRGLCATNSLCVLRNDVFIAEWLQLDAMCRCWVDHQSGSRDGRFLWSLVVLYRFYIRVSWRYRGRR
jgi:Asparagine synthase